jgi:hypothetical protein
LTTLDCRQTGAANLEVLRGLKKLKTLWCDLQAERDRDVLRSIQTLTRLS